MISLSAPYLRSKRIRRRWAVSKCGGSAPEDRSFTCHFQCQNMGKRSATTQSGFSSLTRPIRPLLAIIDCPGGGPGDHTRPLPPKLTSVLLPRRGHGRGGGGFQEVNRRSQLWGSLLLVLPLGGAALPLRKGAAPHIPPWRDFTATALGAAMSLLLWEVGVPLLL